MVDSPHMGRPVQDHPSAPRTWDGYRRHTVARSTGALVVLVDAAAQGISPEDGGRWALICDEHASLLQDDRQATLVSFMSAPEDWCEGCAEIVASHT